MSPYVMLLALAGGALSALAPATVAPEKSNKGLQFVRAIRDDLRRDNDDYEAGELREQRLSLGKGKLVKQLDTRRALNASAAAATSANLTAGGAPAAAAAAVATGPVNVTHFRSNVKSLEYFKKLRIDKLKRLIDKGKNRLRELMEPGAGGKQGGGKPGGGRPGSVLRDHETETTPEAMLVGVPAVSSEAEGDNRVPTRRPGPVKRFSPSPDQIDMAPARGVHVHMMRLQGRLCQRLLLNPEGPLYDHHGTTIMPPHAPELAHGREFQQTRQPNVVLPRCCNCCKKSVLGCQ